MSIPRREPCSVRFYRFMFPRRRRIEQSFRSARTICVRSSPTRSRPRKLLDRFRANPQNRFQDGVYALSLQRSQSSSPFVMLDELFIQKLLLLTRGRWTRESAIADNRIHLFKRYHVIRPFVVRRSPSSRNTVVTRKRCRNRVLMKSAVQNVRLRRWLFHRVTLFRFPSRTTRARGNRQRSLNNYPNVYNIFLVYDVQYTGLINRCGRQTCHEIINGFKYLLM